MKIFRRTAPLVPVRGVHLDLKGLPPTPRRLLEWLDLVAAARLNCVLVEWEDTYPWQSWPELRCATAYSEATVRRFLSRAEDLGIRVVPLVQSFGHLENVLGRPRFRRLRERADIVGDLCPCKPAGRQVIAAMIDDVLRTHAGRISHFHLGGDEVWSLGTCPRCKAFVRKRGKAALYLQHIEPLLERLRHRGVRPILWDDMMREWPAPMLRQLARHADLMPWSYGNKPFERIEPGVFERFRKAGLVLWGAGAFKGADGPHVDICRLGNRTANLLEWAAGAKRFGLAGVVATGWSRYSTFRIPCEGMEASLDALVLAGAALWDGALPDDAAEQARAFLLSGPRRRLAPRFAACRAASEALDRWWNRLRNLLDETRCSAFLAGERERYDPLQHTRGMKWWCDYLAQGRELAEKWQRVHRGLADPLWLRRYAASRLWLPETLFAALSDRLKRERKRR